MKSHSRHIFLKKYCSVITSKELSSGPPRFRGHPVLCPRGERGRGREGEGQLHRGHQGGGPGGGDRSGRGVREPGRGRMRGRKKDMVL